MNFENRLFTLGQMDKDSSPSFVENGKYLDAVNIRPYNPENGDVGEVTPVQGNRLITYNFTGFAGTPQVRVVGSKRDLQRQRIYWMVYAALGSVSKCWILYYDYRTNTIETIFNFSNIFGWSFDTQISCIDIFYDDNLGDTLLWEDGGEPKKLNVKAAFNRFNKLNNGQSSIVEGDIAFAWFQESPATNALLAVPFIATQSNINDFPTMDYSTGLSNTPSTWQRIGISECYPPYLFETMFLQKPITPYFSPNATYVYEEDGSAGIYTSISQKSFQFRYKYVYFDGQESEWSPASEAVFSTDSTSIIFSEGATVVDVSYPTPSGIKVKIPVNITRASAIDTFTEAPHSMIARVKVAVREVPEDRAPDDWYQFYDITEDEIYNFNISSEPISEGFPPAGTNGTFFYPWDLSYRGSAGISNATTITVVYNGTQTLIPVDILDSLTLFYNVPKSARCGAIIDNVRFWGGTTEQVPVSFGVLNSFKENLEISETKIPENFNINQEINTINTFDIDNTGTSIVSDRIVRVTFDTDPSVVVANYADPFFYSFRIEVKYVYEFNSILPPQNITVNIIVSGNSSGLSPLTNAKLNDFVDGIIEGSSQYSNPATIISNFDASASTLQLDIDADLVSGGFFTGEVTAITSAKIFALDSEQQAKGFFRSEDFLAQRTIKNHSEQQVGFAFQDKTGRMTPVISGDWATLQTGHFLLDDFTPTISSIRLAGLSNLEVPQTATVMHILRKRSESYSDFVQFSLSMGNCPTQSWNNIRPYHIGFLNLDLDDFGPDSFTTETRNLYISLNAINGGDGAAYDTILSGNSLFKNTESDVLVEDNEPRLTRRQRRRARRRKILNALLGGVIGGNPAQRAEDIANALSTESEETEDVFDNSRQVPFQTFLPQTGDTIRFLYKMDGDGVIDEKYEATITVKSYSETWNTIVCDFRELESKEPELATFLENNLANGFEARIVCELIKKTPTSQDEFYWESAAQLSCQNGSILNRSDRIFIFGDAYLKLRGYCIKYEDNSAVFQNFILQDGNYSDLYLSKNTGQGRPNAIIRSIRRGDDIYPEIQRDNLIRFSEKSIQETDVRRLGTVYDTNAQDVDNSFGIIEYLDGDGDRMDIYQEDKMAYCYVGRGITTELSGQERVIASRNSALSDVVYMPFSGGISNGQAGFAKTGYRKYLPDSTRGSVYRKSLDGIEAISEVGMSGFFKSLFSRVRQSYTKPLIRGIVDDRVDEYIMSVRYGKVYVVEVKEVFEGAAIVDIPQEVLTEVASRPFFVGQSVFVSTAVTGFFTPVTRPVLSVTSTSITIDNVDALEGEDIRVEFPFIETLVYSERTKGWTTRMNLGAEWLSEGIQSYHAFSDGQMWIHNTGETLFNNFFGRQFNSSIQVASNANPQEVKVYKTLGVKTTASPEIAANGIATSEGQNSRIPQASFKNKEGNKTSELYRDSNIDVRTGPRLRGRWMTANITLPTQGEKFTAFGVVFNHQESPFTK